MRVVVLVKEVLDPDAVGAYALAGNLNVGDDGRTITQTTIPRLMNAYDEQAIEAALRLRDAGAECSIQVVSIGEDLTAILRHALSLGADEVVAISPPEGELDWHMAAELLASYLESTGGADLVFCGRQASDDDQGVVPGLVGEALGMPIITVARSVELAGSVVRVTRATPDGDEIVEADLPAVITVGSELGEPRYPTMPMKMAARKVTPTAVAAGDLPTSAGGPTPRAVLSKLFVPVVSGDCEMIDGDGAAQLADRLVERLLEEKVVRP